MVEPFTLPEVMPYAALKALADEGVVSVPLSFEEHMRDGVFWISPKEYGDHFEEICKMDARMDETTGTVVLDALAKAAQQFRYYAQNHREKAEKIREGDVHMLGGVDERDRLISVTLDKAKVNDVMAEMMENAIGTIAPLPADPSPRAIVGDGGVTESDPEPVESIPAHILGAEIAYTGPGTCPGFINFKLAPGGDGVEITVRGDPNVFSVEGQPDKPYITASDIEKVTIPLADWDDFVAGATRLRARANALGSD